MRYWKTVKIHGGKKVYIMNPKTLTAIIIIVIVLLPLLAACGISDSLSEPPEAVPGAVDSAFTPENEESAPNEDNALSENNATNKGRAFGEYSASKEDRVADKNPYRNEYWDNSHRLDPRLIVITDDDSGDILSARISQSFEKFTEQTAQTFENYYYKVAMALLPGMTKAQLGELLEKLYASENWIDSSAEPYPATVYFTDKVYCYAYFQDGAETICFDTDVANQLPGFKANNVDCIQID